MLFDNRADWESWPAKSTFADSAYLETFGINLLAGRNFRMDAAVEEYIVNQTMARQLGVDNPDDLLGKSLLFGGMYGEEAGVIVGVVNDYNTRSLREPIEPTVIGYYKDLMQSIAIKLNGQQIAPFIDIEWWMFVQAGLVAIAIALATIGLQAISAALANPVDSLRDE